MVDIHLPKGIWRLDEMAPLGRPGGFGAVYRGEDTTGNPVAIKKLFSQFQNREMSIAEFLLGHGLSHIIPIIDAGFDHDLGANFIIMPVAEKSLQQMIDTLGYQSESDTLLIIESIARGISQIGDIVHRDIKPANVLLHDGVWKLADLGLARFGEATTSLNTMRDALSPQYAAPEQWRGERPTKATDIYALGCIFYTLLRGTPPFSGPELADFRNQHQLESPPKLDASSHVKRIASTCLAKAPQLRPSVESLLTQIHVARERSLQEQVNALADAAAEIAEKAAIEEGERVQLQRSAERRRLLATEAVSQLEDIFQEMVERAAREAPNVKLGKSPTNAEMNRLDLGGVSLDYSVPFKYFQSNAYRGGEYLPNGHEFGSVHWDVLSGGFIGVNGRYIGSPTKSANLWFGRLVEGDEYRWWEVAYTYPDDYGYETSREWEPFGVFRGLPSIHPIAEDPIPITHEFIEEFIGRWLGLFGRAARLNASADIFGPKKITRKPISAKFRIDKRRK